jgi:tetratricopeptide (TPR) repeat protein
VTWSRPLENRTPLTAWLAWRPAPRMLLWAGAGLLALVLVVGGAWFWISTQAEHAQALHADALAQAHAARNAQSAAAARTAAVSALENALAQAPGAALAAQSAYELGNLRFDAGQYAGARAAYEVALAKAGGGTVRTLAQAGVAATWEAERNFAKAIEAYTAAAAGEKPGQFYYEDLLLGLARNQELAGRRDDAIQTYRRLLKDVPKLRREDEIRGRLASLGVSG